MAATTTTTTAATTTTVSTNNIVTNHHHYRNKFHQSPHHPYFTGHLHHDKNNDSYDDDAEDNVDDYDDDDYDDDNDVVSNDSIETVSDELPVWAFGEQRWISGVNEDTTCADLINVLLADEGITGPTLLSSTVIHQNHHHHHQKHDKQTELTGNFLTSKLHDLDLTGITQLTDETTKTTTTTATSPSILDNNKIFVITERWRRVEQILSDDTKVLQIWSAWGQAKSQVKLTLRQIDASLALDTSGGSYSNNDKDSGMGSPIGSTNSAIIRRRKHRAAKSTAAWVTQAHTMHPKSQKTQIEKLMKLILEQGETIQQQLAKLRDRELQIAKIEEERHKNREKEHGKNYLLETYLNGLHEVEEKEVVTGNSDSGVQTEGALSSPEICSSSNQNEDDDYPLQTTAINTQSTTLLASLPTPKIPKINQKHNENLSFLTSLTTPNIKSGTKITTSLPMNGYRAAAFNSYQFKEKPSHREKKLLKEHKQAKEYSTYLLQNSESNFKGSSINAMTSKSAQSLTALDSQNAQKQNQNEKTKNLSIHLTNSQNNDENSHHKDIKSSSSLTKTSYPNSNNNDMVNHDIDNIINCSNSSSNDDSLSEKIHWMEKLVMINKHLQREEELVVRLGAKIRKYESENPLLDENQIREALSKVNNNLETGNMEIEKLELDLLATKEQLENKSNFLQTLNKELIEKETDELIQQQQIPNSMVVINDELNKNSIGTCEQTSKLTIDENKFIRKKKSETRRVGFNNTIKVVDIPLDDHEDDDDDHNQDGNVGSKTENKTENEEVKNVSQDRIEHTEIIPEINNNNKEEQNQNQLEIIDQIRHEQVLGIPGVMPDLKKNDLVENLYNYSQYISKPNYEFNEKNENKNSKSINEKLPTTNLAFGSTNTLPLRSKTSTGILKNKNSPIFLYAENQSSETQMQSAKNMSNQLPPVQLRTPLNQNLSSQMYVAPPPPGFESPNFNSSDLLTTISPENQHHQYQLVQQNQPTPNSFEDPTFYLNQAKNLNFTKSVPIVNSKNINPMTLSKDATLQKHLYFRESFHSKSTINTLIPPPINGLPIANVQGTLPEPNRLNHIHQNGIPLPPTGITPSANFLLNRQANFGQFQSDSNRNVLPINGYISPMAGTTNGIRGHNFGLPNTDISIAPVINSINSALYIGNRSNVHCSSVNKLAPKRFLNPGICNELESNSDTGVSSISDDAVHLGTLV